ncbi:hypothetical protein [Tardiphaga robiniae]|jgi:hypothetical protein|uniref:Uncharacterized protein n=1 Tax=Tardiphaga robiniae TaxID=943830 RepID=A0A7G6TUL8_9BRAD|nr:hypothetical protein [Tardiphaga robiniae]QND70450.1 hypothetical protein HB776_03715 [Tardiphaga robiniae]
MINIISRLRRPSLELSFGTLLVVAAAIISPASAMPMLPLSSADPVITEVKIVCEQDGTCFRPARRRPVARWIYGDKTFFGPYVGPGNYGDPSRHWRWFPFFF